ncbi:MAG: hypothetical protein CMP62_00225 [Flavobacteriales bacterium]|nr:hypothetical protein [Flavobacteriales bacterium]
MKINVIILSFLTMFISLSLSQENIVINHNAPEITFEQDIIDLGEFMQYDDPSSKCEFKFTNTGKEPLIISKCKGSCGCTVPECPKEPILPGETGLIKVNYDEKRVGSFNKSITITSNAQNTTKVIKVKGKIIAVNNDNGAPVKKQSGLVPKAN